MDEERLHYSHRLARLFKAGDRLSVNEVAEVLTVNSGRIIKPKYVTELARQGILTNETLSPRVRLYRYEDVREYVVLDRPGRHEHETPSASARRQREWKAKHLKK